jgi:hypothetical protein
MIAGAPRLRRMFLCQITSPDNAEAAVRSTRRWPRAYQRSALIHRDSDPAYVEAAGAVAASLVKTASAKTTPAPV